MGYRGKVEEQNRARDLRAQGWTLGEICEALGVSKASASLWCRDVEIDEEVLAARRSVRRAAGLATAHQRGPNKLQRIKAAQIAEGRRWGVEQMGELSDRDLLVAGAALYAGEGSKTDGTTAFANSDPRMIGLFLCWFRRFFSIEEERLRLALYLHQGLDLELAKGFWSGLTGIPEAQFRRPYRAVPDPSIRRSKHPTGCATVIYHCSATHRRVMGLVQALLSSDGSEVAVDDAPSSDEIGPG